MSFSSDVKKEICSVEQFDREALKAELYGMLLFSRNFSPNKITFTTESNYAGNRLIFLLQNLYMPIIEKQSALRTKSSEIALFPLVAVMSRKTNSSTFNSLKIRTALMGSPM